MKNKKSQGEIFGVALLFVIILIGVVVYSKYKAVTSVPKENLQQEGEYKILAEGTLNTLMKMSTGCIVERDKDSIKDLINYCLENGDFINDYDPDIECGNGQTQSACSYTKQILNESLMYLFNSSKGLGEMPFEFNMDIPQYRYTYLSNITFTNFGTFNSKGTIVNETNRRALNYKRAPSGLITWATSKREITLELYLYYR